MVLTVLLHERFLRVALVASALPCSPCASVLFVVAHLMRAFIIHSLLYLERGDAAEGGGDTVY